MALLESACAIVFLYAKLCGATSGDQSVIDRQTCHFGKSSIAKPAGAKPKSWQEDAYHKIEEGKKFIRLYAAIRGGMTYA
jgi:hypothetical protein